MKMPEKRKRDAEVVARGAHEDSEQSETEPEKQTVDPDVFRKYFETRFEPLVERHLPTPSPSADYDDEEDSDESEWDGISEDETDAIAVQVVEHQSVSDLTGDILDKSVSRRFMSAKPPKAEDESLVKRKDQEAAEDDPAEKLNLKHDLELQRLLKESHLLQKSKSTLNLGSHRHRALDMRLQTLGSKSSLFAQEKMPLSHRKGIVAKATDRESRRRQDAQENGVILERAVKIRKSTDFKRKDPGIGAPVVGKFRGGTLKLSPKDLREIHGPAQRSRSGKRDRH